MSVIQKQPNQETISGPLYRRIQNTIHDRVVRGEWEKGQVLPSRRQLCAEFKTTSATLDKAIQGLISDGVLRASRGSGTFVADNQTPIQRALRIGVVIKRDNVRETLEEHWDENFYFGPLFAGIRDAMVGQGEVIYAHLQRGDYKRYFYETNLDGMILVLPPLEDMSTLYEMAADGIPFVATGFSTGSGADDAIASVDVDNTGGAIQAVRYLLDLGHKRVAIVNLALSQANHHDRFEGYRRALAEAGLPLEPNDLVLNPTYNVNRFEPLIEDWLARAAGSLPTAIFACDYLMTLATLRVLRRQGIRVPEDISVVSFDDPVSAGNLTPPLTTIRQPVSQLGRVAADRLIHSLQGLEGSSPLRGARILPTKLIVRESAAPPRSAVSPTSLLAAMK